MRYSQHYAATDVGLKRSNNEDCYLSSPQFGLWLVADGMGGHAAGEVASSIASETIQTSLLRGASLGQAIQLSHRAILDAANSGIGAQGMGSTVVALHSTGKEYKIAWVGDSRAYLWSAEEESNLTQLTSDHSYVQLLFESGVITEAEMSTHPERNIITQCLGSLDLSEVNVDEVSGQWHKDDWILLCSDGLTDNVDKLNIARILNDSEDIESATQTLIQAALDSGGSDNITVQIVACPGGMMRFIHSTTNKFRQLLR